MHPLLNISSSDLRAILDALRAGRLTSLSGPTSIVAGQLSISLSVVEALAPFPLDALAHVIEAVLAERQRIGSSVSLVWTGPEPNYSTTRDTRAVLRDLFATTQTRVVLAGFSFDSGKDLFAPLHKAMTERDVECLFFMDIPGDQKGVKPADAEALVTNHVATFLKKNWPWDERPDFYYDPRRFDPSVYASVHAKCVVADGSRAFVTSANFTDRGQTRNIEVGALVDDPAFADTLASHFLRCAHHGLFIRVPGQWLPPHADPPEKGQP